MEYFEGRAGGLVNTNLPSFDFADPENFNLSDNIATNAIQSVFGRVNYNFKERYLFEANLRYDGSSRLAPENRYQLFPSFSAGWRIAEESWFNVPFVSQAKFRGSWGQLGNADVLGNYGYIGLLRDGGQGLVLGSGGTTAPYIYQNTLASPSVSWETIETSNLGIDLGFLADKLSITADYFIKKNKEMLAGIAYPSVIGINTPKSNVGELKTWGWETVVSWRDHVGEFRYWVTANLADAQNELIDYYGADVYGEGQVGLLEGYPVNSIWGYKTDGFFTTQEEVDSHPFHDNRTGIGDTKYLDLDGDGEINQGEQTLEDHGDLVYLGNNNPRYTYGIQGGFEWKWIDFSVFFQGVGKRALLLDVPVYPYYFGARNPFAEHLDYWTPENPDAFWPRPYANGRHNFDPADRWVQNASYLRLKDLQVGFTFPDAWMSKIGVQKLRVYFAGRDLWEKTKVLDFIDPEIKNQTYQYPFSRRYTIGLNLSF